MTYIKHDETERLYKFRGKTFLASPHTIQQLNYALGLNRSNERYVEVKEKDKV